MWFKKTIFLFILFLVLIVMVLSACGSNGGNLKNNGENNSLPANEIPPENNRKTPEEKIINPLTGLMVPKDKLLKRPFAVVIENEKKSRPQSGLYKADVVYEVLAEGGITRFLALYLSYDPEKDLEIGPVRSARPYLIDFAKNYGAVFVHYGGSPQAYSYFKEDKKFPHIDGIYDNITFYRQKERPAPHNAYTSMDKIVSTANRLNLHKDVDIKPFEFSDAESDINNDFQTAEKVEIPYNNSYKVTYIFDKNEGIYRRFMNENIHADKNTNNPITTKNLLILYMNTKVIDKVGRLTIETYGYGNGFYVFNGKCVKIFWERKEDGNLKLLSQDKKNIKLRKGNIWIQVVPQNTKIKFDSNNN
ncbi:DUF3048 domain-containing protein [Thermovenabulum gondwanense]|uniref:Putative lipoprotein YerB n=1 Tax=Thermovenabulum gondwanense TaxID=520767 RepID=A0A162MBQ8_9FIRM|nr:DUF3048 domain-containing protein [Thermovenabulum gondwanense]KYO65173.1 putative lipoprotein YerB [Thermovenabulum gondwanense]